MLVAGSLQQLALFFTVFLSFLTGLASSTPTAVEFSTCVDACIQSSGCKASDARCMCRKAARDLLESVISCLFFNCKHDLLNYESSFLNLIKEACDDINRDIPRSRLQHAEAVANTFISMLHPFQTTPITSTAPSVTTSTSSAGLGATTSTSKSSTSTKVPPSSTAKEPISTTTSTTFSLFSSTIEIRTTPAQQMVPTPEPTSNLNPTTRLPGIISDTNPFAIPASSAAPSQVFAFISASLWASISISLCLLL